MARTQCEYICVIFGAPKHGITTLKAQIPTQTPAQLAHRERKKTKSPQNKSVVLCGDNCMDFFSTLFSFDFRIDYAILRRKKNAMKHQILNIANFSQKKCNYANFGYHETIIIIMIGYKWKESQSQSHACASNSNFFSFQTTEMQQVCNFPKQKQQQTNNDSINFFGA